MPRQRLTLVSSLHAYDTQSPNGIGEATPALGVLTLAALLGKICQVELVDLDSIWRQSQGCTKSSTNRFREVALRTIVSSAPDVLGFSSISGSYPKTICLASECHQLLPETQTVFGGPQASVVDVSTMQAFPFVDFIVRGEAEESFPALLTLFGIHSLSQRSLA